MAIFTCAYCGSEFNKPVTSGHKRKCDKYLEAHPKQLPPDCVCGHKSTSLTQMKRHRVKCDAWANRDAQALALQRHKETFEQKYGPGVTNSMHVKEIQEKVAATNLAKYGVENLFSKESPIFEQVQAHWDGKDRAAHLPKDNFARPEIKKKIKKYWNDNYGVDNASQVPEIRAKQLQTSLEKYGHEHSFCAPEVMSKKNATVMDRYGVENSSQHPDVIAKIVKTNIKKYGFRSSAQHSRTIEKSRQTHFKKYGDWFCASDVGKAAIKQAMLDSENTLKDGIRKRPKRLNNFEQFVHSMAPELMFTGNGVLWKHLKLFGGSKNPDFIIPGPDPEHPFRGIQKVVEALGVYWHGPKKVGLQRENYESFLVRAYQEIGIECLVVWEDEMWDNTHLLQNKLDLFMGRDSTTHFDNEVFIILQGTNFGYGRGSSYSYMKRFGGDRYVILKFTTSVRRFETRNTPPPSTSLELDRVYVSHNSIGRNTITSCFNEAFATVKRVFPHVTKIHSSININNSFVFDILSDCGFTPSSPDSQDFFFQLPSGLVLNQKQVMNRARRRNLGVEEYLTNFGASLFFTPTLVNSELSLL